MTRTEYDVVALGELLIDFTAQGRERTAIRSWRRIPAVRPPISSRPSRGSAAGRRF